MSVAVPVELEAVERLAHEFLGAVRDHYHRRPQSRASAQEVLNAAAVVVALVLVAARACGDEDGAREFFELALEQQLADGVLPETLGELDRVLDE